jgi:hypothetical protein
MPGAYPGSLAMNHGDIARAVPRAGGRVAITEVRFPPTAVRHAARKKKGFRIRAPRGTVGVLKPRS